MSIITLDDLSIKHHFGDNEYIKETKIDAGVELEQHKHNHSQGGENIDNPNDGFKSFHDSYACCAASIMVANDS